ncbi:MAG TPA: kelch repeat-containing protein [Terriglobales bacterium]|jgi:hypothetical protein|nr:kelch repeat-containing protein [Terriglobales bacterium]
MKLILAIAFALVFSLSFPNSARCQSWQPLRNQPSFNANTALLLTDGTVMVQAYLTGNWWRLTPDNTGSYVNGTWSQLASMPSGYGPLYYASAVLPDGRVVIEGGEYNLSQGQVETNLGAVYNPASNAWTSITAPSGWGNIGDAQSVVLANGTFMLGNCCSSQQALLNASNLTWTITGSGKADGNSEEGWELLPSGDVLVVDASDRNSNQDSNVELYNPSSGSWSSTGFTPVDLVNTQCSIEIGPGVLRPDGTVFAVGGISNTSVYNPSSGIWSVGPTFPAGYGAPDAPGALLPDGNVLVQVSPFPTASNCSNPPPPSLFYEFNGTTLTAVPAPPHAPSDPSFVGRMLVLPTGQILWTDQTTGVEIYTPSGTYNSSWEPSISSFPSSVTAGTFNNAISGTLFNGLSQGAMYGDDAQAATNYPLVRITNNSTGHVFYCKTHNHSTMSVDTGSANVSTQFDVPTHTETGASTLAVVANGIPSISVPITVAQGDFFSLTGSMSTTRYLHTATTLQDGTVLIAGSYQIPTAEVYNPLTGTTSAVGNMHSARYSHTATLLNNGTVLITGGCNGSGTCLSSAELYNPATRTFTVVGNMSTQRQYHTATLLQNGMVLITGGCNGSNGCDFSADLYNPSTETFTATGNMSTRRYSHTATLLNNGNVLVTGGCTGGGTCLSSAEIYSPITGTFTVTGSMSVPRRTQTAAILNSGEVLIAGGCNGSNGCFATAELYNPATGTFALTGSMSTRRYSHTATVLLDGTVLQVGGCTGSGTCLSSAEFYNPATGGFTTTSSMSVPRYEQTAALLNDGTVLVSGGCNGSNGCFSSEELYHP